MLKGFKFSSDARFSGTHSPGGYRPKNAFLIIFTGIKNEASVIKLNKEMTIGREVPGNKPDISVDSPIVSRKHGVFTVGADGFYYDDTESFNGTYINGVLYKSDVNPNNAPIRLNDGDVLRFDSMDRRISHNNSVTIIFSTSYDKRSKWRRYKAVGTNVPIGLTNKNITEFDPSKMAFQSASATVIGNECTLNNPLRKENVFYNNCLVSGSSYIRNRDAFKVDQSYIYYENGEFFVQRMSGYRTGSGCKTGGNDRS